TPLAWEVAPWGRWQLTAENETHRLTLVGKARDAGGWVRVPTREGLQFLCRDTTHGELQVQLWSKSDSALPIIDASSHLAGLEVGGAPWDSSWIVCP
ncbi:MAG: tocopherol cyclase, partial [Leptolyngbya sp. SIO4C1]|nr:tocopherol cyclase [Leptolyngbya sp. SIO4C1]